MQETKKYDFLDGLRWLAILLVLLSHIHYTGFDIWDFFHIWLIGVPLFFMISAYTLALSQDKKGIEKWRMKHFFLRRFFRIYPLYIVAIIAIFMLWYAGIVAKRSNFNEWLFSRSNLLAHITFTNGFSSAFMNSFRLGEWSLFNEIWFYILFVVVFPVVMSSFRKTLFFVWWMGGLYIVRNLTAIKIWLDATYIYQFPLYHLVDFSLGLLLLFHIHKNYFQKHILTTMQWAILSVMVLILFVGLLWAYSQWFYINHLLRILSLFLISSCVLLYLPLTKLLSSKILVYLGKVSYSVYLLNLPILCMIGYYNPFSQYPIYNAFLAWVMLVVISSLTYKYEEFGISLGRKF